MDAAVCALGRGALVRPEQLTLAEFAALADHFQQTRAGVEVLGVALEVFGQVHDTRRQQSDLDLGGAGVAFVLLVSVDDLGLAVGSHNHSDILLFKGCIGARGRQCRHAGPVAGRQTDRARWPT